MKTPWVELFRLLLPRGLLCSGALEDIIVTEAFEEVLRCRIHNNNNTQNSLSSVKVTKVQDTGRRSTITYTNI